MTRRALVTCLALTTLAGPALADLLVYVPQDGGGVVAKISDLTPEEAAIVMDDAAPPGGTAGVVIEAGKAARWTTLSPTEVNEAYGGTGAPVIEPFPDVRGDTPSTKTASSEEGLEKEGLGEEGLGEEGLGNIVPMTGLWRADLVDQRVTGCPDGAREMFVAQAAAMSGTTNALNVTAPFHPRQIHPALDAATWTYEGADRWRGEFLQPTPGMEISVTWTLTVESPERIVNDTRIAFNTPIFGQCEIASTVDYIHAK